MVIRSLWHDHTRSTMYYIKPFQYDCTSRWLYVLVLVALRSVLVTSRKYVCICTFYTLPWRWTVLISEAKTNEVWYLIVFTCIHGDQLLIAIIDTRAIANAYYYGVSYARPGLLRMRRFTSRALERWMSYFCSRKPVQSRIHKIAVRYDRQKFPILSVKINRNPSDPCVFQLMVYKCGKNTTETDDVL